MNQYARIGATPIPFIDVVAQRRRLGTRIDEAIARVLGHCQFILGPEVKHLEDALSAFCGALHTVSTASGTDALVMVLLAKGIGQGDAVLCPGFTFCATAEAIALVGATPVFIDILADSFNIDPASLKRGILTARGLGLNPKAVCAVDLFGMPADYDGIAAVAEGLFVLADAAQSFGATYKSRPVGTLAPVTATSFFPAKPLGCYGDGGAVLTDDGELASVLRSLRVHGQGLAKDDSVRIGLTARLDTLQAAVLLEKLKIFPEEISARDRIAARYAAGLADVAIVPSVPSERSSVWSQYTIRLHPRQRAVTRAALEAQGIPTAIYYPRPLHCQEAYRRFPVADGGLPVAEAVATEVLSLPMHAYLKAAVQDRIIAALRTVLTS
jgi:dTDP-4-amino-4,6-dideoxygalactose transaminase